MMRRFSFAILLVVLFPLLSACFSQPVPATPTVPPPPTPSPTPVPPSAYTTAEPYFKAWEDGRYGDMYDLLSSSSQASITKEKFIQRYQAINSGSTILSRKIAFTIDEKLARADSSAAIPFTITMVTGRVGELKEDNTLPTIKEGERWRVEWSPSLIFKDLTTDGRVLFESDDPSRGSIVDRKGRPLAAAGKTVQVGVVPNQIEDEAKILATIEKELQVPAATVKQKMQAAQPGWFVPLKDLTPEQDAQLRPKLEPLEGIIFYDRPRRSYPNGSLAAHVIGYMGKVNAEDLKTLATKGYEEDDFVGRAGIEGSMESVLAGERGGKLSILDAGGRTLKVLADKPAKNGQDVQLSIDIDAQKLAEDSLGNQAGSVVVINPQDNSVIAMASYPRFDPNQFITGFSDADWKKLNEDPLKPFQNRPVASIYPTGSVFKVVTMAAGMEKGGFTADSQFDCNGKWTGLGNGQVLGDWLPQGHGHLNLFYGLAESCDIVFYELGKKLDSVDPNVLPTFARAFGYGKSTGINGLQDNPGLVPDPAWKKTNKNDSWYLGDSVNFSIGQGFFLATPLQVANSYAAIARDGKMMTPLLVMKAGDKSYQAQPAGDLPVSAANLDTIRKAMKAVVADPKGSAVSAFQGLKLSFAGKSGSAETKGDDSHAWFAAYAPYEKPQVAMILMVEDKGLGSEIAAPLVKKFLQGYFK